ncbi:MAG: polymer-forming cytoskeletal protein [Treponema sp.]|jgi:cytoskeletal protein CcmA (bactofilin family)|nr:polymer-forming cytoskeletal protein [Treponema sp.]MDR0512666.1 polymer-forming cytoskeletal protein [Treponema sp.]
MVSSDKRKDFSINTIIGPGTNVSGNIESGGFTRVDGNVSGDVKAKGQVVIGERARMKSNIDGTSVTVGGVVIGNVLASEDIVVLATGLVMGDIITQRIKADEGCLIHGRVRVCRDEEAWRRAVAEYRDVARIRESLGYSGADRKNLSENKTADYGQN